MKKISNKEDIVDILYGDIDKVKLICYFTHLEPDNRISPIVEVDENYLTCRIPSSELSKLKSGQLVCTMELVSDDDKFDDGEYNTIQTDELNVWIKEE